MRCPTRPFKWWFAAGRVGIPVSGSFTLALVLFALVALPPGAAWAQGGSISGTVVAEGSLRPLAGAQVVVEGGGRGTLTDSRGRFLLTGLTGSTAQLRVVMLGYRPVERSVEVGSNDVRIALGETAIELDEVVVTGTPGAQQVRSLGNAVGKVKAADVVQTAPPPSVQGLIGQRVPGVQISSARGEIGAGGNIRIRGVNSMTLASEPLIYVDGVRVNGNATDQGGVAGVGTDARTPPSRLNDFNPEDIESIEIIKGPAAATLYGTEASNGVIQIITKRGKAGKPTVNLTIKQGMNWLPDPEELFPSVYYRSKAGEIVEFNVLRNDRMVGFPVSQYGFCPSPYSQDGDRCKGSPFSTGRPQAYSANVSGGSDDVRYYFSLDWDRDEGPVNYNWQNRLNGRANMSWTASDKLSFDFGLGGIRSRLRSASAQQPLPTAIIWACPVPGCEPGSGATSAVDGPFRGYIAYLPERYENDIEGFQDVDRTTYSFTAKHNPFSWFNQRLIVGGDFTDTRNSELYRRISGVGTLYPRGRKQVATSGTAFTNLDYSATVAASLPFGLSSSTSGGLQYYEKQYEWAFAQGEVFPVRQLETVRAGATKTADEDYLENKTFGAFIQEQLSWKDRVFLTAAVRGDDNSAFGKNYDFVVYPKLSASWVVSEEPFMANAPLLNTLKLRAAWGRAGQQPDVFAALRSYAPQVGAGGAPTLSPENLGNLDLEPEVGEEFEMGFDASFFEDRLGVEFTYYDQLTDNAIVRVPALPSLGFPGVQFRNLGQVANSGLEVGVNGNAYSGRNVNLDLNFTYSTFNNEIVDIGGGPPLVLSAFTGQYHVPGFPMASIFEKRVVSADITQRNNQNVATNLMCEGGERVPGTNFSRGGGAPVPCADAPAVHWGSPLPTWNSGASATMTLFNNLQLFALVEAVGGNTMINGDISFAHTFFGNTRQILERTDPILLGYIALGGQGDTQPGLIDASFAKLRRVSASYTLPQAWAGQFGADRATLTLSGENLATLWVKQKESFGVKIVEHEIRNSAGGGADPGGLTAYNQEGWPQMRRFLATIRVSF